MSKTQKTLLALGLNCLVAAGVAYFLAREQDRIRSLYGEQPQTISVADLAAKGYGDNVWVNLTDAEPGQTYVIQTQKGKMSAVWVPVFPKGQAKDAKRIQVILRSTRSRSDADIAQHFADKSTFQGAVINPTLLWPNEPYRALLAEKYPKAELAPTIWEVDVDYTKPSTEWASRFYIAAAGLGVVGVVCGLAFLVGLRGRSSQSV